jgi:nucleotidyltransferase substrate binding protein (TIGR01987 family)
MKKFDQYVRHLRILSRAFDEDLTNDFIVSGIIDKYYIQFELGWKVLKELLRYEGTNISGFCRRQIIDSDFIKS